ncbi:MAG TPA: transcriptional regulator NrdR [Bdellovibrionales bacterium]|nr:transcriptional regulator NrdR [Bdellovibrionales bacterium]
MKCPQCGHLEHRVLETRTHREEEIRRRRECLNCKLRFSTVETLLLHYPQVIKKDGRREPFSKEKLRRGIQIACKKRPVAVAHIENLVNRISRWVETSADKELGADRIGQAVVKELKTLDDVAYVRFASVYKSFRDVNEFMQRLEDDAPHERQNEVET